VLALYEPTNHVDSATREFLIDALGRFRGIGLLVSHDRALLDRLCTNCLMLKGGRGALRPGNYTQAHAVAGREMQSRRREREQAKRELNTLSDMATVLEAIDSRAFSEFCGVDSSNQVPDGDTLGRFRNLLIKNELQEKLFTQVVELLQVKGLILKKGSIVDSTLIEAPPSIKNREKQRDPDAHQTKKGNQWHFGYKAHISVDKDSGLVQKVKVTAANVSDIATMQELLTGEEEVVYGDSGYLGAEKRADAILKNKQGKKIRYKINRRPSQIRNRSLWSQGQLKRREREKSSVRAKVEHVFAVVKGMFRY
jgi:IS5 family transposase